MFPICQRYALKAIHNHFLINKQDAIDVSNMSKIRFESNSQQATEVNEKRGRCFQYVKDTLWKQFTTTSRLCLSQARMFPICQRYALKAIHNKLTIINRIFQDVSNMSKIRFESNSQPPRYAEYKYSDVSNMSKIRFESNSQQTHEPGGKN